MNAPKQVENDQDAKAQENIANAKAQIERMNRQKVKVDGELS